MTVKEMIKLLNQYPDEAVVEIEFLSVSVGASYSAEPKLVKWGDKVKILTGRRTE